MAACKNSARNDLVYVEDSEPERKRIRLQASETKPRKSRRKQLELRRDTTVTISCPADDITTGPGYFSGV